MKRATATVYTSSDGRRAFTARTAARREAAYLYWRRYECECEKAEYETGYGGHFCAAHQGWEIVKDRLARWILYRFRTRRGATRIRTRSYATATVRQKGEQGSD